MKRLLFLLCIFLPISAIAGDITVSKATAVAEGFFASRTTKSSSVELVWTGSRNGGTSTNSSGSAPFYVFNRTGGGFVIISGTDVLKPVLGYSFENSFETDGMPEHVSDWFNDLSKAIEDSKSSSLTASKKCLDEWARLLNGINELHSEKKYTTALWGQDSPYNIYCPQIKGKNCLTGCVATATAIVMRYFEWPSRGHGSLDGYNTERGIIVQAEALGREYKWGKMPLEHTTYWNEEEKSQVARLIYQCGVANKMNYGLSFSGASESYMASSLTEHFDYVKDANVVRAKSYSSSEWIELIKKNLDENGPLIFFGKTAANSGHCFVLDGYDSNDNVSVNWGWNGIDNGYYSITDLGPTGSKYVNGQGFVANLKPVEEEVKHFVLQLEGKNQDKGFDLASSDITQGYPFNPNFSGTITNYGDAAFSGTIFIAKANNKGNCSNVISEKIDVSQLNPGASIHISPDVISSCTVKTEIEDGDKLKLFYQGKDDVFVWNTMLYDEAQSSMKYEVNITDPGLEKPTSVEIDRTEKIISITTLPEISISFTNEEGQSEMEKIKVDDNLITIPYTTLPKGIYHLTISKGVHSKTLDFKF